MAAEAPHVEERAEVARRSEVRHLLAQYAAERDERARERLVQLNTGLVRALARRFAQCGESLEDLEQVGFLGLIQAIERFDPARGTEFASFAAPTIMGEIRRHFRECSWSVRVPRRLQETYLSAMRAQDALTQELGSTPSVAQIASRIDLDADQVLAALEVSLARKALSLDSVTRGPDHEDRGVLGERLGEPDAELARSEARMLVEQAMARLSPRERRVMTLRVVDQLPHREVAQRLGLSPTQVRDLQRAALERMRGDLGVVPADEDETVVDMLTKRIQGEAIDPLERAGALRQLRARLGVTSWDEVGGVVGLTRRHIHHLLNVTRLPDEIQEALRTGQVSEKHARALVLLRVSQDDQATLWRRIRCERLSGDAALKVARELRASRAIRRTNASIPSALCA